MKFAACVALLCCSGPASGYTGYRLFTINHTLTGTANSTNFTVLLSGTFAEFATTANGGEVQNTVSCGVNSITCPADLVFTSDSGCSNPLGGWEFESYTATTGQIIAWVIVPTLSVTTNTLIYACVGNAAITTFQGGSAGSAFDSNTKVVYHFPNGTALSTNDSSSGGYNATPANSPTAVTGEIGGGVHFNGSDQDVESSSFPWTGTSAVTVSFWNYVTSSEVQTSFAFTVGNSATTDPHRFAVAAPWESSDIIWDYGNNTTGTGRVSANYTSYLGAWTYVTLVSTGSANTYQAIYLNGAVAASASSSASSTVTGDLIVGAYPYANQYGSPFQNGSMDEFRISSVVRSASWILAEYNNQSSPSTFATASSFVPFGASPIQQVVCDYSSGNQAPCTLNSSTITIPLAATQAGSALIMTYGGGSTSSQTISSVSCTGCTWVQAITCTQTRVVSVYYALNVPSGTTTVTVTLNSIDDWWFNVSEWSLLPSSGTVIDNNQTGCTSSAAGGTSTTQTSASVTTTRSNDLIIFADRATVMYSSGPTNGFVNMSQSGNEELFSAYYLPGATGMYSSSFSTSSAAIYVTAVVAFLSRPFQRSHITFGR
ncbi:MAG: hypothetical protein ABSA57_12295 [Candidatus Acidiferrales bacterium]|jgi:hypothetical protein